MEVVKGDDAEAKRQRKEATNMRKMGEAALSVVSEFMHGEIGADQAMSYLALSAGIYGFGIARGEEKE